MLALSTVRRVNSREELERIKSALSIQVPVPEAKWLAPVQVTTVGTVLAAVLVVIYHLFSNVLPLIEGVERTL